MFGHDTLNHLNINNLLHNAEGKIFLADKVTNSAGYTDADYTTAANGQDMIGKSGKTNPVKWDATKGIYVVDRGDGFKSIVSNATDAVKFRKGFMTRYYRGQGENFVFESFSPNEPKVVKPFMTQDEFDGVDTNDDTNDDSNDDSNDDTNGDDDSNGDIETLTDVEGEVEPEEGDNTILYGIIGMAVVGAVIMLK